jgi:hypothetical protein
MKPHAFIEDNNNWKEKALQYYVVGLIHHCNEQQDNHYSL